MKHLLVAGLINLETTLRIEEFPVPYFPVRYPFNGVRSTVSGVGFNLATALTRLGSPIRFLSLIGNDPVGGLVRHALSTEGIDGEHILPILSETPQSVILYDAYGKRQINVDLKEIQETPFPASSFLPALDNASMAALCNVNFTRPFLREARHRGIPVATDVHAISSLDDAYNLDYLQAADILFASDEALGRPPEDWAREVISRFPARIVVVGMGRRGAMLVTREDGIAGTFPAVFTRPVKNTIGAGDALFSAFLHGLTKGADPVRALRRAMLFASWKIGETGAAMGLLSESSLLDLERNIQSDS
ncbi:MAG: carbohydrate kinase family protein [Candidatus Riflebacteria bacterium]|nr:carbohydrate kinase family protein [Candidatus Riflebacteria bacterium]